jgi:uncharacterized hydrophobic protein (TIGR00271 family)
MKPLIRQTEERRIEIQRLISEGSDPRPAFFLLVGLSTLIAAFGLIMNSTAVVIGAMLVAPLMTPILGLALALLRGDGKLMRHALRAEIAGVLIAIAAALVLGLAIPHFDVTPEMLGRTTPNLLDMAVAVFAGLAGAFAMVDERVSPVLPGVAISTAIVPPLANAGLCLSLGAWLGAWGSFLLFFTNFLSILLASAAVFFAAGMIEDLRLPTKKTFARRFGPAALGFLIVGTLLSFKLATMIESNRIRSEIQHVLTTELSSMRVTYLDRLAHQREDGEIVVFAHVHAPNLLPPSRVRMIESRLADHLNEPVDLFLRTTITQDVSSTTSSPGRLSQTLDGFHIGGAAGLKAEAAKTAEQIIRNYLDDKLGLELEQLKSYPWGDTIGFIASISGPRPLRRSEVAEMDRRLAAGFGMAVRFHVRQPHSTILSATGPVRGEFGMRRPYTDEEVAVFDRIDDLVMGSLQPAGYSLWSRSITILDDGYYGLFEVVGPRPYSQQKLLELQTSVAEQLDRPFHLYVRSVPEVVVCADGHTSLEQVLSSIGARTRMLYDDESRAIIDGWR